VALIAFSVIVCGSLGFGAGWLIGKRLSVAVGIVAAFGAVVGWFFVAGVLLTQALATQSCTDCNDAGWAFLILDPLATIGFLVGLIPGMVAGRRAGRASTT
jgi:hypothetical protein